MKKLLTVMMLFMVPSVSEGQNEIPSSSFTIQFVDSQEVGYEARLAIDNDITTMWTSAWVASNPPFPHEIVINLNGSYLLYGIGYLARQDGIPNGNLGNFEVYTSNDGSTFQLLSTGTFTNTMNLQNHNFPIPIYGRFIKLRGLSSVPESTSIGGDSNSVVAAEIKVYKFNGVTDKVRPGEPFIVQANHDGQCTVGYRLYANDVVISTQPVSALSGGIIQLPGVLKEFGYYQFRVSAYTMDMCNITAQEAFSESIIVSVENTLVSPGLPIIIKSQPPMPISPETPASLRVPPLATPPTAKPTTPPVTGQPKPRVFSIPQQRK